MAVKKAKTTKTKKAAGGKTIRVLDGKVRKGAGKPVKKAAKKKAATVRQPTPLHEKLFKLFLRPQGATLEDTMKIGFKYPAMAALKIAERHGFKTSTKKDGPGELTRYMARR